LSVQRVEHVVAKRAADGQEELASESCVEVASAEARKLDILGQELCRVHLDVEPAHAARFLEQRANAAPACVLSQRHWETGARQVVLELLERRRGSSCREPCHELRRGAIPVLCALLAAATAAQARITRIVITRVERPTFGGASFGSVGQFEKLVGTAYGEVDPKDPHNAIIQDIALAPRNAHGMVEY